MRDDEEFNLTVEVRAVRGRADRLRVEVTADAPTTWTLERLEESAVVKRGDHASGGTGTSS